MKINLLNWTFLIISDNTKAGAVCKLLDSRFRTIKRKYFFCAANNRTNKQKSFFCTLNNRIPKFTIQDGRRTSPLEMQLGRFLGDRFVQS